MSGGDAPEQRRAPAAQVENRVAERSEQEARIRERDHEAVVPAQGLEELAFLDHCLSHALPPCLVGVNRAAPGAARATVTPGRTVSIALRSETRRAYNRSEMRKPPITIKCECGETRDVAYGERWRCERCQRSWDTRQIPADEYDGLLREDAASAGSRRSRGRRARERSSFRLIVVVNEAFIFADVPIIAAVWLFLYLPMWRRRVPPRGQELAALGASPRVAAC